MKLLTERQRQFLTMVQAKNRQSVYPRGGKEDIQTIRSLILKEYITFNDGRCRITDKGVEALGGE